MVRGMGTGEGVVVGEILEIGGSRDDEIGAWEEGDGMMGLELELLWEEGDGMMGLELELLWEEGDGMMGLELELLWEVDDGSVEGLGCAVEGAAEARGEVVDGGDDGDAVVVGLTRFDVEITSVLEIVGDGTRGMIDMISSVPSLSKELLSWQWLGSEPQTQVTPPQNCTGCGAVRFHSCAGRDNPSV